MHRDITPLCAADIQDQLKKRFAYLSGERRVGEGGVVRARLWAPLVSCDCGPERWEPGTKHMTWPALGFTEGQENCAVPGGGRLRATGRAGARSLGVLRGT